MDDSMGKARPSRTADGSAFDPSHEASENDLGREESMSLSASRGRHSYGFTSTRATSDRPKPSPETERLQAGVVSGDTGESFLVDGGQPSIARRDGSRQGRKAGGSQREKLSGNRQEKFSGNRQFSRETRAGGELHLGGDGASFDFRQTSGNRQNVEAQTDVFETRSAAPEAQTDTLALNASQITSLRGNEAPEPASTSVFEPVSASSSGSALASAPGPGSDRAFDFRASTTFESRGSPLFGSFDERGPKRSGSADILGGSTDPGDTTTGKRRKKGLVKRLVQACTAVVVAGALIFVGLNMYITMSTDDSVVTVQSVPSEAKADCILILGASVRANRKPSPMLLKRLERGLELYRSKAAPKILVSGDNASVYYNEVKVMREWLQDRGVPPEDIFEDHAGFSTYESMYRARDVFKVKRMIVVSQRYHLARAIYTGDALGLEVWGVAANGNNYSGQFKRDVREWGARIKDFGKSIYEPEPRFLGPAIPITGDGRKTM